ncbi:MAG: hypothetical protein QXN76_01990 [Nanopusillaceae archaeon]
MIEYKYVDYRNVQRLLMLLELDRHIKIEEISNFSKNLSENLKSKILFDYIFFFPSKNKDFKDFTYISILSSSHIVISSYSNNSKTILDIDAAWCSNKKLDVIIIKELVKKSFGNNVKILNLKIYDYLGNVMMAFSSEE